MKISADHRASPSDEPFQQAWVWLRLLTSGDAKAWDVEGFERWLHASPAHESAFRLAKQQWATLKPVAGAALRRMPDAAAARERGKQERARDPRNRRAFLAAATGAAAVAGVALVYPPAGLWPAAGEWGADYRTATGEQQALELAPRIKVTLNTQTRIRRQGAGGEITGIELLSGEAAIDIDRPAMASGGRAFAVVAGSGRSLAEDGRFEVRNLEGKICVTCIEGSARVEHPLGERRLAAHQQLIYDGGTLGLASTVDPAQASAWRKGELVFNNTRLAEVIAEINRYRPGRVLLMNASVRDMPVSGSFYIASLSEALSLLQRTYDLKARSLPGGLYVLS